MIAALCEHLWQSTLFASGAWVLTLALRNHGAGLRHSIWLAASIKFLVPFSLLVWVGETIELEPAASTREAVASVITILAPFSASTAAAGLDQPSAVNLRAVLIACWIAGAMVLALRWLFSWLQARALLRAASPLDFAAPVVVKVSRRSLEPGVVGAFRPVLLLPCGVAERFSDEQLRAIVAHELCHVERRDNLKAAVHMLVEVLFWFHPVVWWIGARLLVERERACDEAVLEAGHEPRHYAEGMLNVCRLFHRHPLVGAAAGGGDLKQRIEGILSARRPDELTPMQSTLLRALTAFIVAAPIAAGAMTAHGQHDAAASAQPETLVLTAPGANAGDEARRVHLMSGSLRDLIGLAYGMEGARVHGEMPWLDSRSYRLEAVTSVDPNTYRALLTQLLADRFNLQIYVNRRCQEPCGRSDRVAASF